MVYGIVLPCFTHITWSLLWIWNYLTCVVLDRDWANLRSGWSRNGEFYLSEFLRATATWFSISSCLGGKDPSFFDMFFHFWVNKTPRKQFFPSEGAPFSAEHASWRLEARGTGEPWSDWSSWILWTFFWAVVNLGELAFLVATQNFGGLYNYHRFLSNRGVLRRGWRLIGRLILETTENRQTDEKIGIEPANRWNILGIYSKPIEIRLVV